MSIKTKLKKKELFHFSNVFKYMKNEAIFMEVFGLT